MSHSLPLTKFYGLSISGRLAHRLAVSCIFFLFGISFSCFTSRIPDIKQNFGLDDASLGLSLLFLAVGQFCTMFFSSYLVGKFGSRRVLTAGMLINPAMLFMTSVVSEVWQLRLVFFLMGVSGNFMNISINTQGVGVEKIYGKSIMGSFHGMWSFAGCSGLGVSMIIIPLGVPMWMHLGAYWLLAMCLFALMRRHLLADFGIKTVVDGKESKISRFPKFNGYIMTLGLITFCCMASEGTMFDWSIIYFRDVLKVGISIERFGFFSFMLMMAMGRFSSDFFVMRFGPKLVMRYSGILIASGLLLAVLYPSFVNCIIGFALVGCGVSGIVPLAYSLAGKSNLSAGSALTAVSGIGFFGFLFGPPVIGFISSASSLRCSFSLIAAVGFMITIIPSFLKIPDNKISG